MTKGYLTTTLINSLIFILAMLLFTSNTLVAQINICPGETVFLANPPLEPSNADGSCPPTCLDCFSLSIDPSSNTTAVGISGFNVNPTVSTNYTVTRSYFGAPGSPACPSVSETYFVEVAASCFSSYCEANANNISEEWIDFFGMGCLRNGSGANSTGYEYFNDLNVKSFQKGREYDLEISADYASEIFTENFAVFIDYNQDNDYIDEGEMVFLDSGQNEVNGTITIPADALTGETHLRVIMNYSSISGPCGSFGFGEVEEYIINIIPSGMGLASYCASGGNTGFEWIERVLFSGFSNVSGDNCGFGDYTSLALSFEKGEVNSFELTPGFSGSSWGEFWQVWMDLDQSGSFDDGEMLFASDGSTAIMTGQFSVPESAATGLTRMRIIMSYNSLAENCDLGGFSGETEDYMVNISEAILPPVSDFTYTPNGGDAPVNVQFSDASTNFPDSYTWTFTGPDVTPSSSSEPSPLVTFNQPGTYTASLLVSNSVASDVKTVNIEITELVVPPVPDFYASITEISETESVVFTNQTTDNADNLIWTFEGGTPSSANGPGPHTVVYNTEGSYDVTLAADNIAGINVELKESYITVNPQNLPPVSFFTANNTSIVAGNAILFSSNSTNEPTAYQWSFPGGDPISANTEGPHTVVYNTPGTFDVTLIVTNSSGSDINMKTAFVTVEAPVLAPICDFTSNQTMIEPLQSVQFSDLSINDPDSWRWTFPGGLPNEAEGEGPHTVFYENPGTYPVLLKVTNSAGEDEEVKEGYITVEDISGLNEINFEQFTLGPNPSNGNLNLRFSAKEAAEFTVIITDIRGWEITRLKTDFVEEFQQHYDLSMFPDGIYLLSVNNGSVTTSKKFLLVK